MRQKKVKIQLQWVFLSIINLYFSQNSSNFYITHLCNNVCTCHDDDLARLLSPKTANISRGKAGENSCSRGGQ